MKKVKFHVTCPGCKNDKLLIKSRRPTYFVPAVVSVKCDQCESTAQVRANHVKGGAYGHISYQFFNFKPSEKLIETMKASIEAVANGDGDKT